MSTIQFSDDNGKTWKPCESGGFSGIDGGRGVAYNPATNVWVAVGQDTTEKTIQRSIDDGKTWNSCESGGFAGNTGLGVAYNPVTNRWVAVGDINPA